MTYAKRLTEDAKVVIGPILAAIHRMKPGEMKSFEGVNKKHTDSARSHLYAYFSQHNLRQRYKIMRTSDTLLSVLCKVGTPMFEVDLGSTNLTVIQEFYRNFLIDIDTREEALEYVRTQNALGEIHDEAVMLIMAEWDRQNET